MGNKRNRNKGRKRVEAMLSPLIGQQIPGGCDDCDAYQEVQQSHPGIFLLTVVHDDTCPFYIAWSNRGA